MSNGKGGLIRKKDKPKIMARPEPVKKTGMDFGFKRPEPVAQPVEQAAQQQPVAPVQQHVAPAVVEQPQASVQSEVVTPAAQPKAVTPVAPQQTPAVRALTDEEKADKVKRHLNLGVGKSDSTKSLKVPAVIHTELGLLGSFMDENKTYIILQKLIDSYVKNDLTDRQQRQFEYMIDAFLED